MRLTRVLVPGPLQPGRLALPAGPARHVARVLRLGAGDALRVFDGEGREFEARIEAVGRDQVQVEIGAAVAGSVESPLSITLLQGVARGEKMDLILQKATELGVTRITPLLMARGNVKLDAAGIGKRHAHWQAVSGSACEQCGRNRLPWLDPVVGSPSLAGLLDAHPDAARRGIRLLVGPEGGFDDAEIALALASGFIRCRLGPRILRTETAALAAIAALQCLAGDWR